MMFWGALGMIRDDAVMCWGGLDMVWRCAVMFWERFRHDVEM